MNKRKGTTRKTHKKPDHQERKKRKKSKKTKKKKLWDTGQGLAELISFFLWVQRTIFIIVMRMESRVVSRLRD